MPIISEQVKIMLERMDMHPDEFVRPFESRNIETKWNDILQEGRFNRIEKFLIMRKYVKLRRQATRDAIMATIMYDEPKQGEVSWDTFSHVTKTLMNNPRMRMKQK